MRNGAHNPSREADIGPLIPSLQKRLSLSGFNQKNNNKQTLIVFTPQKEKDTQTKETNKNKDIRHPGDGGSEGGGA